MRLHLVWWSTGDAAPKSDWYSSAERASAALERWLGTLQFWEVATVVIELHDENGGVEYAVRASWAGDDMWGRLGADGLLKAFGNGYCRGPDRPR